MTIKIKNKLVDDNKKKRRKHMYSLACLVVANKQRCTFYKTVINQTLVYFPCSSLILVRKEVNARCWKRLKYLSHLILILGMNRLM
jgi:hypothetical protein